MLSQYLTAFIFQEVCGASMWILTMVDSYLFLKNHFHIQDYFLWYKCKQ